MTRLSQRLSPTGILLAACGFLLISLLPVFLGCSDDSETLVIELEPWGLDFNSELDSKSNLQHFMYLVERAFYLSVIRFQLTDGVYTLMAAITAPATGGFSPSTVDVATGGTSDVMFVTDVTEGAERLLAVKPDYTGDVGLDSLLLAETGDLLPEEFIDLRGVASLYIDDNTYRVFLADDNKVWILDYLVAEKEFTLGNPAYAPIPGGCGEPFLSPAGVAVDGSVAPLSKLPALYVTDKVQNALFRFSGIGGGTPPVCDAVLEIWDPESDHFEAPRGVAVLPDESVLADTIVAVADSRKTDDGNDRVSAFSWDAASSTFTPIVPLPGDFNFYANATPFDLAFDASGELWATYPEAAAIAGPSQTQ